MRTIVWMLLSLAPSLGCAVEEIGAPEGPAEAEHDGDVPLLAVEPAEYECELMSAAARAAVPPPPPAAAATPPFRVRPLCPAGQVPRYRQREIPRSIEAPPPGAPGAAPAANLAGSYWYAGIMKPTDPSAQSGVGAIVLFSNPAVYDQLDMVTSQMSIVTGANYHLVEIGLRKFWDAFPRLMISQWSYGTFNDATGFVTVHGTYAPGMPLSSYYGYAVQHYVRYDAGNWWVWFNDAWVGYFPGSIWAGGFTAGTMAHFYGEVYSAQSRVPPLTDMGNGLFSSSPSSAYMQSMCLHAATPNCYLVSNAWTSQTNGTYYSLSYDNAAFMRFGGNGGG